MAVSVELRHKILTKHTITVIYEIWALKTIRLN